MLTTASEGEGSGPGHNHHVVNDDIHQANTLYPEYRKPQSTVSRLRTMMLMYLIERDVRFIQYTHRVQGSSPYLAGSMEENHAQ